MKTRICITVDTKHMAYCQKFSLKPSVVFRDSLNRLIQKDLNIVQGINDDSFLDVQNALFKMQKKVVQFGTFLADQDIEELYEAWVKDENCNKKKKEQETVGVVEEGQGVGK